jgi:parallel beta-helix repeat protein
MNASAARNRNADMRSGIVRSLGLSVTLVASVASAGPLIFTVTNTADTGNGSLRQAILDANANSGPDTIQFNIPGNDSGCNALSHVCTIKPSVANAVTWPRATSPVTINGYSQTGASVNTLAVGDDAKLLIEQDATNLTDPAIYLGGPTTGGDSSGSTIKGLVISHINNGLSGICACSNGNSNNDTISGNFIGTDATGTAATSTIGGFAIEMNGSTGTVIGGSTPDKRNVMATNQEVIYLAGSDNSIVQGNYIGIDKTGTVSLASGRGIHIEIGSGNLIGGATPGAGNVDGNWTDYGIRLDYHGNNNRVQGNLIGTDATGTVRLGGQIGVEYVFNGTGNMIGGAAAGEGNVIAGATNSAVRLREDASPDLKVQGNLIGTDIGGRLPLGNANGIIVASGTGIIGGTSAGEGNRIAFSSSFGVSLNGGSANVPILGNEIYANGGLGISLSDSGAPTPNDDDDGDGGNNHLQNYPVISNVTIGPKTMVHVSGSLNSTASATFRLEFFANANCAASGNGQGKRFIGSTEVTTNPNDVAFGPLDIPVPADRHVITATATELAGAGLVPGSTSEFSVCSTQDTIFSDGVEGN